MFHSLFRRVRVASRIVVTSLLALVLALSAVGEASAQSVPSGSAQRSTTQLGQSSGGALSSPTTPRMINWTPYDGSRISTLGNCNARMNWLKTVRPDIRHWTCQSFETPACPKPLRFWMVMVGTNNW